MPRNRSLPPHLEIRRAGFFWRRRLPRSLRDRGEAVSDRPDKKSATRPKKVFLCFSLRSHVLRDAKILARRLTEMSDMVFAADAETTMAIAPEIQERLLESLARFEIEAFERARAYAGPRSPDAAALELRREEALQKVLRDAIWLQDREVARHPLRHVAAHLGLELDETDEDWRALAYKATQVLLDVSNSRSLRQQGIYEQPTLYFRRAVNTAYPAAVSHRTDPEGITVAPAAFATSEPVSAPVAPAPASFATKMPVAAPEMSLTADEPQGSEQSQEDAPTPEAPTGASTLKTSTSSTRTIVPAGLDLPEGYDEESWQKARIAARPPMVPVDRTLLSEQSRAALEKKRGITLTEAIELYFDLLSWGHKAPFNKHQKLKRTPEKMKAASVEERLCEDHRSKRRLALDYWPAVLGDEPVDEISVHDVDDALERLWRVPANHGKSEKDRENFNLIELIEKAEGRMAQLDRNIAVAKAIGASSQEIDKMRLEGEEARISVTTYVKHGRVLRGVGEMLMDMQLIDQNPFSICTWSNKDVEELKSTEGQRKREAWDDRINDLWGSKVFQEPLDEIGDPLFWAPLIARHQGMRMEEILQLGPEDFGTDKGIPYLRIRHTIINGVKTLSSARTLPVHPQLIELGLLKLVALRKKDGHIRIFPFLNRGKQKDTFSANFSKNFGYYRRTNGCYWAGLDFHALRTTFHHDLLGDDKSDAIRCRLMGHTYTDTGDRNYGQNLGIDKLAARMKSVVVDISMIRRPFEEDRIAAREQDREPRLRVVG